MVRFLDQLPEDVSATILSEYTAQWASVSAAGVPINTPSSLLIGPDETTLDIMTGLAYPIKAERARRNPKVGLLIEATGGGPVISVAAVAAVRDADLQANVDRGLAETALVMQHVGMKDWASARQAIWYFTRIFILAAPFHIRWWPSRKAMNSVPHSWRAPADMPFPQSDPAPRGPVSKAPAWPRPAWQDLAHQAFARGSNGHLTLLDSEGFPIPIGVLEAEITPVGFSLSIPRGAPWCQGKASLTYEGVETFVGEAIADGDRFEFKVERPLPILPFAQDITQVLTPTPENRAALMSRLEAELARRGQPAPIIPEYHPEPTPGARRRHAGAIRPGVKVQ